MEPNIRHSAASLLPVRAGIGLRAPHLHEIRTTQPDIGFLEVHPENYFGGGAHVELLDEMAQHYPLSFHGVGLSLGAASTPDARHVRALKALVDRIKPAVVSDHVSWSATGNAHLGDLLPLPYTPETLQRISDNIAQVQEILGRKILVENPSTYLSFTHSTLPEPEFLAALCERTGCGLLLDLNNIYVQSHNIGADPQAYFRTLDATMLGELHLAGHTEQQYGARSLLIDTHNARVREEVWVLYAQALQHWGALPTLIEWDSDIPALAVLQDEAAKAEAMLQSLAQEPHYAVA